MDDLAKIKKNTAATTDTAAINEAVMFRARLAEHELSEIENALTLWEEVKRQTKAGASVFIEKEGDPNATRTKVLVPAFG